VFSSSSRPKCDLVVNTSTIGKRLRLCLLYKREEELLLAPFKNDAPPTFAEKDRDNDDDDALREEEKNDMYSCVRVRSKSVAT
jgi:hypothetical protein